MDKIDRFKDEYEFLSNFGDCPNGVEFEGILYPTSEHAYQAAKTEVLAERQQIAALKTPGKAKHFGRHNVTLRSGWKQMRIPVMRKVVTAKFMQNPDLMAKLLATGKAELIEGNYWGDTFWGVCNGEGKNFLGKIEMNLRDILARDLI